MEPALSEEGAPRSSAQKKKRLESSFYQGEDVLFIARSLLGKRLCSHIGGILTGGLIIETEAYKGEEDRACHAYGGRRTRRTEVMYQKGGITYVYFCYGMHHLLNIVTHTEGTPHAVLIRALLPTLGIDVMQKRRGKNRELTSGPAMVCQALGITLEHNALPLSGPDLWIEEIGLSIPPDAITTSKRIGVSYAQEDAHLPYRFTLEG